MSETDSNNGRGNTPNASELLDFEPMAKSSSSGRGMVMGIAAAILLAGVGVGAFFYMGGEGDVSTAGPVPLILPPAGEVKARPENPGGMAIPDRDKLVYGRIDGTADAPKFERLLPPPETPLEPPTEAPTENIVEAAPPPPPAVKEEQAPPVKEPVVLAPAPAPAPPAPAPVPAPPAPKAPPAPAKPEPVPAPPTPTAKQGYMVQLSALKTEDAAKAEWQRIIKQNGDVLGGLSMNIQRADLGAKGIFFRLRGAYLPDRKSAEGICAKLATRKVGCLIIAP